jgi:predicted small secreted protein
MKNITSYSILGLAALTLVSCNTTRGFGSDLKALGGFVWPWGKKAPAEEIIPGEGAFLAELDKLGLTDAGAANSFGGK